MRPFDMGRRMVAANRLPKGRAWISGATLIDSRSGPERQNASPQASVSHDQQWTFAMGTLQRVL